MAVTTALWFLDSLGLIEILETGTKRHRGHRDSGIEDWNLHAVCFNKGFSLFIFEEFELPKCTNHVVLQTCLDLCGARCIHS